VRSNAGGMDACRTDGPWCRASEATDVKFLAGRPGAAEMAHATRVGCYVITMSLGGVPSLAFKAAVRAAVTKGVIVLAAAGNCVRIVVYPARYDAVIAVAGVNI